MVLSREQETVFSIITEHNGAIAMGGASHYGQHHNHNSGLTKTQKKILLCLEQGCTKQEAAEKMGLCVHTFDAYLREIYRIIDVHTMTAAVAKAIRGEMI